MCHASAFPPQAPAFHGLVVGGGGAEGTADLLQKLGGGRVPLLKLLRAGRPPDNFRCPPGEPNFPA